MAIGSFMISCGGEETNESIKDIKVSEIKDACGCAEATVQVMELIIPHKDKLDKLKSKEEILAYLKKHGLADLENKKLEIDKHCQDMGMPDDDCDAFDKMKELSKKMM